MGKFLTEVRDSFIFLLVRVINNKLDARSITKGLDKELDKRIGSNLSERLQR